MREPLKDIYTTVLCDIKGLKQINCHAVTDTFGQIPQELIVHEDSQACLNFASIPRISPRTKHIAIPYDFCHAKMVELEIEEKAVNTENQLTDQFTKGLIQSKFESYRRRLYDGNMCRVGEEL